MTSQAWVVDGLRIRVEPGHLGPSDRVVFVASANGGDCKITFGALGLVVGLLWDNEERVRPRPREQGGEYVLAFLRAYCEIGADRACRRHRVPPSRVERVQ